MKPHLEKQHDLLQYYSSTKNDDYLALANQLKEANNDLKKVAQWKAKATMNYINGFTRIFN